MRLFALVLVVPACAGTPRVERGEEIEPGLGPKNAVPASARPSKDCSDVTVYTLDDLAAGKGNGERIGIDLVPAVNGMCTLLDCGDSKCCNQCGGDYGARLVRAAPEPDLEVRLSGPLLVGCGGYECNFHCEPFGRSPTSTYRFVGKNTYEPAGKTAVYHQAFIEVEKFCTL